MDQPQLTAAAAPTEARISLRAMFILTAVAAVLAALFGAVLRPLESATQATLIVIAAVAALFLLGVALVLGWLRQRAEKRAGAILFQLEPHSYLLPRAPRLMSVAAGATLMMIGIALWVGCVCLFVLDDELLSNPGRISPGFVALQFFLFIWQPILLTALGMACIWWNGRIRFCDKGIVQRQRCVFWGECGRHYWDACNPDVLVVHWGQSAPSKQLLSGDANEPRLGMILGQPRPGGQLAARVPADQREAVEQLLRDKL